MSPYTLGPQRRQGVSSNHRRTPGEFFAAHEFTEREKRVAREAARAVARYRGWYTSERAEDAQYRENDDRTAEQVVDEAMPDAPLIRRIHVLDAALTVAEQELHVDMQGGRSMSYYRETP